MGKTIISDDNLFEWDENKDILNIKNHGFSFNEILEIFDDPCFLTRYDSNHSGEEDRYQGLGCLNGIVIFFVCFTERTNRIRIISARQAEPELQEVYYDYVKKINQ